MDLMTYLLAIQKIQEVSSDTTYTLTADVQNKTIVLTPSVGTAQVITVPYATDASTVNGKNVPELENGKIPASYLPSYVDDVEEYEDQEHFPSTGESNKIYIDLTTNKIYRWGGTTYVEISESLALGETSSTAFRGDHGKAAYDHSLITSGNPHNVTKTDIGLDNVGNFKAVSTVGSQGLTTTEQENAKANIGLGAAADKDIDISIEESSQSTNLPTTKAVSDFVQTQTDKVVGTIKSVSDLPAPIASFSGAAALPMPKLEVAIEPQQDLHGYDAPWVGGAGKNKFDQTTWQYYNVSRKTNATNIPSLVTLLNTLPVGNYTFSAKFKVDTVEATQTYRNYGFYVITTGSYSVEEYTRVDSPTVGAIYEASITINKSSADMVFNAVYIYAGRGSVSDTATIYDMQLEIGTTATAYEPYSNICPISGWTEANVSVASKNLSKSQTNNSVLCSVKKGVTYTLSYEGNVGANIKKNTNSGEVVVWGAQLPLTFTADEDFNIYLNAWSANISNIQVEVGNQATAYEPYNGHTYTIQFTDGDNPLTVYGGTLDVVSGELVVDRASVTYNGSENWIYTSSLNQVYVNIPDAKKGTSGTILPIQSNLLHYSQGNKEDYGAHINDQRNLIVFAPNDITDANTWKTWLATNNVQVIYELATPITYQLTPTQVKSLLGSNVWSDTGNILDAQYISYEYNKMYAKYSENIIPTDNFVLNTTTGDITTDGDIIRKNGYWGDTYGGTHTSLIDAIDDLYNLIQQNNS